MLAFRRESKPRRTDCGDLAQMTRGWNAQAAVVACCAVAVVGVSACGSPAPIPTIPNVVGLQLDNAHNVLKDAGYEKFDDIDALGDRAPLWDANWAVVKQAPSDGMPLEYSGVVRLDVMKKDDSEIRDFLPQDSPVLAEIDRRDADRARRQEEEERRRAEEVNKPLDCSEPTFEIVVETWEIEQAPNSFPAEFTRGDVRVRITNKSEHKIDTKGVVFATGWRDPTGRTRSTREIGGLPMATEVVPDPSNKLSPWETLRPRETKEFSRTFLTSFERYQTDGAAPWVDEAFVDWRFSNPDLEELCQKERQAGPP